MNVWTPKNVEQWYHFQRTLDLMVFKALILAELI